MAFVIPSQPPYRDQEEMEDSLELGGCGQKGPLIEMSPRCHHLGPLLWQGKPRRSTFHKFQQLFICRAGGLRGFSLNFLTLKHLLIFLGITQQSTSRWIGWCQRDRIIKIQQLTLVLSPTPVKRGAPSLTYQPDPTANPMISLSSVPWQWWVPNRGKQRAAPLSSKRGRDESGVFS